MTLNPVKLESFGVNIGVEVAEDRQREILLERLNSVLEVGFRILRDGEAIDHNFFIKPTKKGKFDLFKSDETIISNSDEEVIFDRLDSQIRLTVAEFAVGKVFVHSGVVAIDGKAIIIPASSFKGKTTLVAELVKNGAVYFSDEYAVLGEDGLVYPFPKTLSMRKPDGGGVQTEMPVEAFGGEQGKDPAQIGMVLVTEYKKNARWKPEILSRGQGVLEIISHTVPIRNNPAFALTVLNKVVEDAIVVKTKRGAVERAAKFVIDYFEKNVIKP